MGAPQDFIDQTRASAVRSHDFELFEDNIQTVTVFQRMSTQWRTRGMDGVLQGLDYTALPFVMRMCGIAAKQRAVIFEEIGIMEMETLKVVREKQK